LREVGDDEDVGWKGGEGVRGRVGEVEHDESGGRGRGGEGREGRVGEAERDKGGEGIDGRFGEGG
jgi:hypothetical protein